MDRQDIIHITINGDQTLCLNLFDLGVMQSADVPLYVPLTTVDIPLPRIDWSLGHLTSNMYITNIKDISAVINRSAKEMAKYINIEKGVKTRVKKQKLIIEFTSATQILTCSDTLAIMQKSQEIVDLIDDYHSHFVYCPYCESHSTTYVNHNSQLHISCKDCNHTSNILSHKLVRTILKKTAPANKKVKLEAGTRGVQPRTAPAGNKSKKKMSEMEHEAMLLKKVEDKFDQIEEATRQMTESVTSLDGWSPDTEDDVTQRKFDYCGDNELLRGMFA